MRLKTHPQSSRRRGSRRLATRTVPRAEATLTGAACAILLLACGGDKSPTGAPGVSNSCGPLPYFTVLPVAPGDIDAVAVVGGLGAPGHTLPTAQSGILLARINVPVLSPGRIQPTQLRRVTYVASPNRQGEIDYALFYGVCRDVDGWFGHLTTVPGKILERADFSNCERYNTSIETVESCTSNLSNLTLSAGESMGTGGLSVELGLVGLDIGLLDQRVNHFYVTRSRYPAGTFHAVCPWEYFDDTNRGILLSALRDLGRPGLVPGGEPRCGTMEVDVAGTAKGVWAEVGVTGPLQGDETRYMTLANYPYRPEEMLALSLGPAALGARVAVVPRATTGRVNRSFEQVTGDGLMYCYSATDPPDLGRSWLLSLAGGGTLRIEQIEHIGAPGPCVDDPATWSFGPNAMAFVR